MGIKSQYRRKKYQVQKRSVWLDFDMGLILHYFTSLLLYSQLQYNTLLQNITLIMLTKYIILPLSLLAVMTNSLIIPNSEASQFLSRQRRANGIAEELLPSNINRECQKEQCDFEEYVEAKENETKKQGIKLREVINDQMKQEFENIYTKCYTNVMQDEQLSKTYEMHLKCLEVIEEKFSENGYFDGDSGSDDGDNYDSNNYDNGGDSNYYNGDY